MWESNEELDAEFDALWALAFGDRNVPAEENIPFKNMFFGRFGEEALVFSRTYLMSRTEQYIRTALEWRRKTEEEKRDE